MLRDSAELINKRLGNYIIHGLIRETHMSAVYSGKELVTEREVAVKVLYPDIRSSSSEYRKYLLRFQREAILIANLRHPYIVPILAYSEENEKLAYLVMPFYKNGTLGDVLRQQGHLSLYATVRYIEQIAPALALAHSQNVIHRDIKPGNFLLDDNNCLILTDFGIARMIGNTHWPTLTTPNNVLGTPEYMAPELFHGTKADPRADIYALGILIYQMLCGSLPFTGTNVYAIIEQHMNDALPLLQSPNPALPSSVDSILKRATAKRREDRYESVLDLAAALSRAVEPDTFNNALTEVDLVLEPHSFSSQAQIYPPTVPAKPIGIPRANRKKARSSSRNVIWVFVVALLIMLLGVSGFVFVYKPFSPSQPLSTPVSTLTPSQQAQATIEEYYNYWDEGKYRSAYNLLSPDYQKGEGHSYQQLLPSYSNVHRSCLSFGQITQLSAFLVKVMLTINQIQVNPSGINSYDGYFIAQQVQGEWRITPYLNLTSIHGSC